MLKVIYARFHDVKVVIGGQNFPNELPAKSKTYKSLNMSVKDGFLAVEADGSYFGIPLANVQFMRFAESPLTKETPSASIINATPTAAA